MAEDQTNGQDKNVDLHYIKANSYRVIHADGVYGGATPHGYIILNFYSERAPIPQKVTQELSATGKLGKEISRVGKGGIVREVEAGVTIDVTFAKSLIEWLQEKVNLIEGARESKGRASKSANLP